MVPAFEVPAGPAWQLRAVPPLSGHQSRAREGEASKNLIHPRKNASELVSAMWGLTHVAVCCSDAMTFTESTKVASIAVRSTPLIETIVADVRAKRPVYPRHVLVPAPNARHQPQTVMAGPASLV